VKLTLAHLWDGQPVSASEHVHLALGEWGGGLEIHVDAPGPQDPAPPGPAGPLWGLWEHEVVEVFVAGEGPSYTEIGLGPHGHHLVLRLEGVRRVVQRELPLDYTVSCSGGRWQGVARLDWNLLPSGPHRMNAYAIRGKGIDRRYLAWQPVPGVEPDFHQLSCFAPLRVLPPID
jgi:hypothetical protein